MKMMNDAATAFLRCVSASFVGFGMVVEEIRSRSWASATFAGARHELTFRIAGDGAAAAADDFLAHLSVTEFEMRGHIMADICLVSDERTDGDEEIRISLEALTVEDS